jgi:hypothetical protein
MRRTELRKTFGLIAVILLLSLRGFGQATTAELSGTVADASGAVVPGAQIVVNNIATNIAHSTISEKSGRYVVGQLPPGDYTITVEAKGFSKLVQTGLSLQVNQQAQLDLTLKVGAQTETVEVVSQAPSRAEPGPITVGLLRRYSPTATAKATITFSLTVWTTMRDSLYPSWFALQ